MSRACPIGSRLLTTQIARRTRGLTIRNSSSVGGKLNRSGVGCAGGRSSNAGLSTHLYLRKKLVDILFHVDVMYPEVNYMRENISS